MKTTVILISTAIFSLFTSNDSHESATTVANEITFEEVFGNYQEPVFTPVDTIEVLEEEIDLTLEAEILDLVAHEAFLNETATFTFEEAFGHTTAPTFVAVESIEVLEEEELD